MVTFLCTHVKFGLPVMPRYGLVLYLRPQNSGWSYIPFELGYLGTMRWVKDTISALTLNFLISVLLKWALAVVFTHGGYMITPTQCIRLPAAVFGGAAFSAEHCRSGSGRKGMPVLQTWNSLFLSLLNSSAFIKKYWYPAFLRCHVFILFCIVMTEH